MDLACWRPCWRSLSCRPVRPVRLCAARGMDRKLRHGPPKHLRRPAAECVLCFATGEHRCWFRGGIGARRRHVTKVRGHRDAMLHRERGQQGIVRTVICRCGNIYATVLRGHWQWTRRRDATAQRSKKGAANTQLPHFILN